MLPAATSIELPEPLTVTARPRGEGAGGQQPAAGKRRAFVPLPSPRAPAAAALMNPPWIDTGPLNEFEALESVQVPAPTFTRPPPGPLISAR